MIPLPPLDPGLPDLAVALDSEAIADVLRRRLPECRDGSLEVAGCRPSYVRYKPGTSVLVQYAVTFRPAGATPDELAESTMHGRFVGTRRAGETWSRHSFRKLVERTRRRHSGPVRHHAVLASELGVVLQLFPLDRDLPHLTRATARRKAGRLLWSALGIDDRSLKVRGVELVRYRPARKALLRYTLPGSMSAVYAKLYADDRARRVEGVGRALLDVGIPTAEPLAGIPELGALAFAEVPGTRLADLEGSALLGWLAPVSSALAGLHRVAARTLPQALANRESEPVLVARSVETLARLVPHLAVELDSLARELCRVLTDGAGPSDGLVHGDFYDDQVLVSGEHGPILLDLDEAAVGDPRADLGNLLAHISARSDEATARSARTAVAEAYESASGAASPWLDERTLLRFEAAATLHMAVGPFRRLEPDWPARVERLVRLARACLEQSRDRRPNRGGAGGHAPAGQQPAAAGRPLAGQQPAAEEQPMTEEQSAPDAGLPQLADLRDRAGMSEPLSGALGRRVEVADIRVIRHKLGRRCTLRYDVHAPGELPEAVSATGSRTWTDVRLYGKTYASERGARVHAALEAFSKPSSRDGRGMPLLPRPIGFLLDRKLVLQSEVPGTPVAPSLLVGDTGLAVSIAEAIHAVHHSGARLPRRHGIDDELRPLEKRVERLSAARPDLASRARAVLERLRGEAASLRGWRYLPIHRDFYHDQVLVGEQGIALLDLDDASIGEPAVDIANFAAHLTLLAMQDGAADRTLDDVAGAFVDRYRELDPKLDGRWLRLLERGTLLRLAEIHRPRPGGDRLAAWLVERADAPRARAA